MIGIFDSGIGGLTVVKEFFRHLPNCPIIYFGDTVHLPYGTKSPNLIKKWSRKITQWLLNNGAEAIVIACHTSSALAGDYLKKEFSEIPIFEIINPGIKKALKITKNKKIGIIGTPGTTRSEIHKKKLLSFNSTLKIYSQACPLFVPLVEEGWLNCQETKGIAKKYLLPLKKKKIDTLILACTHYPLLKNIISKIMGKNIQIINPAEDLAKEFKSFFENNRKVSQISKDMGQKSHQFFFSDRPYNFSIISRLCLGKGMKFQIVYPFEMI